MEQAKNILLQVENVDGHILAASEAENSVQLYYKRRYQQGDCIVVKAQTPKHLVILVDPEIPENILYVKGVEFRYPIPFGEEMQTYPPNAFQGEEHLISVRFAGPQEILKYHNLSVNPLDTRGETTSYPHCTANVETRGESVFAARNTIDGIIENTCHGQWPYQSWGDDENPYAEIKIEFGRTVQVDRIMVYLRADFPHDNYWQQVTFLFSDGTDLMMSMKKTKEAQEVRFSTKEVEWVKMSKLTKSEEESQFPALTQWEIYGTDIDTI